MIPVAMPGQKQAHRTWPAEGVQHPLDRGGVGAVSMARERVPAATAIKLLTRDAADVTVGEDTQRPELVIDIGHRHPGNRYVIGNLVLSSDFARPSAGEPPPHRACNDVFQQLRVLRSSALEHYKAASGSCGGRCLLVIEFFL